MCIANYPDYLPRQNGSNGAPADFYPYLDVVFEAFGTDTSDIWQRLAGDIAFRYLCAMEKLTGKIYGEF